MPGKKRCAASSKPRKQTISCSTEAQLQFLLTCVDHLLQECQNINHRNSSTPVFLAGVLEYLIINIRELMSQKVKKNRRSRITPECVCATVKKILKVDHHFEDGKKKQAEIPQPSSIRKDTVADNQHRKPRHEGTCKSQRSHHKKN